MKDETKKKVKDTWENYSVSVSRGIAAVGLIALGYGLGSFITELKVSVGLMRVHEAGILKFFNESGAEIGVEKATEEIKRRLL